jgi:hypothetical protein
MIRTLVATAAGAAALLVAVAVPASAQAPATQTLSWNEVDKGSTFNFIDNAPKSPRRHGQPTRVSVGDEFLFTTPLHDASGRPIGRLRATCFITKAGSANDPQSDCLGVFSLSNGQLWASATTSPSGAPTTGAILAGTGAYANMHGTFVSRDTKSGAADTVTLVAG